MKMVSAGAGLGLGLKDYRVIFVFKTDDALTRFLNPGARTQRALTRLLRLVKGRCPCGSGAAAVALSFLPACAFTTLQR